MKLTMIGTALAVSGLLFLASCGGGSSPPPESQQPDQATTIPERAERLAQANPVFLSSEIAIIYDGGSERLPPDACNAETCSIDDQDTTLEELLFSTGFQPTGTRRGVELGRGTFQHFEGEIHRFGGWLSESAFAVHAGILTFGPDPVIDTEHMIQSYSVGVPAGTNPADGGATWNGVMVGADVSESETAGNFVQGDATLTVSFSDATVDVLFNNIKDQTTKAPRPNMAWQDVSIEAGGFQEGATLQGYFYGAQHGEVGGVFDRAHVVGAFGATRE